MGGSCMGQGGSGTVIDGRWRQRPAFVVCGAWGSRCSRCGMYVQVRMCSREGAGRWRHALCVFSNARYTHSEAVIVCRSRTGRCFRRWTADARMCTGVQLMHADTTLDSGGGECGGLGVGGG